MCRSAAACLLGSLVRIPLEAWLFAFWYLFCVRSGLCDELITSSEESYCVCVCMCRLQTSTMWRPMPDVSCYATGKEYYQFINFLCHVSAPLSYNTPTTNNSVSTINCYISLSLKLPAQHCTVLKLGHFGKEIRNYWEVPKSGAREDQLDRSCEKWGSSK